ncbi:DPH2 (YKL191W) [Zygosaccharomyces parabailii]|uniref:2-(3-amino-3-carboxypropyl)histidine synthase subunit 2 n=1 Tax=Zygosaccharomyces bailii (strain CLIB 213 / ATCC 58445 / CBS 680 / BCRC 21525 / NBRC 1098 / NCYC 1416 / NRRL Y-2227) TaxID=1333698 RepID=A0A8J2TAA5_ZYGB2|nr:DPH2 (YKL191W) [Zygosaccharomyces parabailii]CDF91426.1 ZYBA0S11-02586g1_1 [Zygosaccharomyces bailii CLIB 213]CDH17147.1 related to Diphthamide biosynthesis protein 2 [Zygosaccharomyces bailii ISA1307]
MAGSPSGDATVAPVLSTIADDNVFTLQKYEIVEKERLFYLGSHCLEDLSNTIAEYYDIDELIHYLETHDNLRRVTLQFPDALVQDASLVTQLLQQKCHDNRQFWVLADTAYSACCVDEVASEHVNADVVVHFGDACLNAVQTLPVVYSFGRPSLDIAHVAAQFKKAYDKESKICLMANAPYTRHVKPLYDALKSEYPNLIYAVTNKKMKGENCTILGEPEVTEQEQPLYTLGNRVFFSDAGAAESVKSEKPIDDDYHLFHISIPQDPHLLFLTTQFQSVKLYDPKTSDVTEGPFPSLMKRYKCMHSARTSGCIGILVNTLSLKNTRETINALIELIRSNDKKHYLFVVGKPNVAKLANFEPVDVWCILGCGQGGIILDIYNEFYKPIVTPYELTLALNDEVTWTGDWVLDFKEVLHDIEKQTKNSDDDEGDDELEFDFVTGKSVSTSRPLRQLRHLELEPAGSSSKELTRKSTSDGLVIKGTVSTSAAHLQNRIWSGLGSDFQEQEQYEEEGATVEEGRVGIASKYEFDVGQARQKL